MDESDDPEVRAAFDPGALDDWIGDRLPGRGAALRAERMRRAAGVANALVRHGGRDRRPGGSGLAGARPRRARPARGLPRRQVPRWLRQLDGYATRPIPRLDRVAAWLTENRPAAGRTGLMHGDYSPYNVMASPRDPTRLAAVVDWDASTIGDPLLDFGHLPARWTEPGERPAIGVWDIPGTARASRPGPSWPSGTASAPTPARPT